MKRILYCVNSIILNYKSWFFVGAALYLIDSKNIILSWLTFLAMLIISHIAHYLNHLDDSYPFNIAHLYHHSHSNWVSHWIQIILEFNSILLILIVKRIINYQYNIILPLSDAVVFFFYIFYTTVHNINYSIFHINHIHEEHHRLFVKNVGPDISDLLLGTKLNPETDLENTDHYIPNIIGSLIIVLLCNYFSEKNTNVAWYLSFGFLFTYIIGLSLIHI